MYNINMDDNNIIKDPPIQNKSPKNPIFFGIFCGLIGLVIGVVGIFCIMQLVIPADSGCTKCQNSQRPKDGNASNLITGIFESETQGQNIIYSPLSIRYGLSLLNAGAAGTTKTQIQNVLGDTELPQYSNVANTLSLANAVFVRDTFKNNVLTSYSDTVTKDYNAEIIYDNFASTANMDNWVNQKTFGLIDRLGIQSSADTQMVLVNALAIQMDWKHQFDTGDTYGRDFYQENGSKITATTMNNTVFSDDVKYYTDDNVTMLSLPLQSTDEAELEFVAVMPSGKLTDYMNNLDLNTIKAQLGNSASASTSRNGVEIHIPKFKFEYELNFINDLQKLGITDAFTYAADFSNMANAELFVSDAVHKANIDFSEEGIKAAAVTAFSMDLKAAEPDENKPVVINIDHPFFFLIQDKNNGTIWFTGAVYEPNLWANDQADYQYNY